MEVCPCEYIYDRRMMDVHMCAFYHKLAIVQQKCLHTTINKHICGSKILYFKNQHRLHQQHSQWFHLQVVNIQFLVARSLCGSGLNKINVGVQWTFGKNIYLPIIRHPTLNLFIPPQKKNIGNNQICTNLVDGFHQEVMSPRNSP